MKDTEDVISAAPAEAVIVSKTSAAAVLLSLVATTAAAAVPPINQLMFLALVAVTVPAATLKPTIKEQKIHNMTVLYNALKNESKL